MIRPFLLALLALFAFAPAQASPPSRPTIVTRLDAYLRELADRRQFGGVVLVAARGRILLQQGYGPADAAGGHRLDARIRIPIASITKTFTSTAIMVLVDQGRLRLDQSICEFVGPCPDAWRGITLTHLMAQTSGIPTHLFREVYTETSAREILALLSSQPLKFAPGSQFEYANSNHFLLGQVIERVTGKPYDEALADLVLRPLGLRHTGPDLPGLPGRRADALRWTAAGRLELVRGIPYSWTNSASGLVSTVGDLFRYARGLQAGRLLSPEIRRRMWTRQTDAYALGWWIPAGDLHFINGTGGSHGYQGAMNIDMAHDLIIVVMCNVTGEACSNVNEDLHEMVVEGAGRSASR